MEDFHHPCNKRIWNRKDPERKTTPLLVPYDELPESEKAYDRNTALETLKLIVKLGYTLETTA